MQEADRACSVARADRRDSVHDRGDRRAKNFVRGTGRNGGIPEEGEGAMGEVGGGEWGVGSGTSTQRLRRAACVSKSLPSITAARTPPSQPAGTPAFRRVSISRGTSGEAAGRN